MVTVLNIDIFLVGHTTTAGTLHDIFDSAQDGGNALSTGELKLDGMYARFPSFVDAMDATSFMLRETRNMAGINPFSLSHSLVVGTATRTYH